MTLQKEAQQIKGKRITNSFLFFIPFSPGNKTGALAPALQIVSYKTLRMVCFISSSELSRVILATTSFVSGLINSI
jgi:hypothetical protein